ncbi:MAG: long-chain-fatty-acid--CoA ligase [Dehalococcoidia bacterium]
MFVYETLDRAARLFRGRDAVVCGDVRLTYGELDERVRRFAGALVAQGVAPGDRVGILMHNCHRYLEAYLGTERAGAVLEPLNQRLAPPELVYILNHAEATALIVDAALLHLYEACRPDLQTVRTVIVTDGTGELGQGMVDYEQALAAAEPLTGTVRDWAEDDMVQLYYTSGTTGRPKGVMLSQRNVMANAMNMIVANRFMQDDTYLHAAPMFHLADAWACFSVTWMGGRHVFLREFSPRGVLQLIERERVTVTILVSTMINAVVNLPDVERYDLSSWRLLTFGASPMPLDRLRAAMRVLPCRLSQLYGMTETAPLCTQLVPEDVVVDGTEHLTRRLLSCGREVPGVQVRVVREDGSEVTPGEVGEIIMHGPNVMLGYWRLPEVSAETLRGGWMHSGDLATVDDEGYIYIVDRKKDMIISGGENVFSTEVEDAIYKHPAVLEAAVIGVPDERWGERVHAIVVLKEGQQLEGPALSDFCRQHIAGYKIPRSVDFVPVLPKTGSGKIQKADLRDKYWQGFERRVN